MRPDLDLAITVGFLTHALGEGMLDQLDQLDRRLGMTLPEYLDAPERVALVRAVTTLFRHGAGVMP